MKFEKLTRKIINYAKKHGNLTNF